MWLQMDSQSEGRWYRKVLVMQGMVTTDGNELNMDMEVMMKVVIMVSR